MARTTSLGKGRSAKRKGRASSPFAWLLSGAPGRLLLLGLISVIAYALGRDYLWEVVYPSLEDNVLHAVGYGFVPMTAWALLFLASARFKKEWLSRYWRWGIASALLTLAAQTLMGGIHGSQGVPAVDTLGGLFGASLWGGSAWIGLSRAALFALAGLVFSQPQAAHSLAKATLLALGRLLLALLRLSGRGLLHTARAAGRKGKELFSAIAERRKIEDEWGPNPSDYEEAAEEGSPAWTTRLPARLPGRRSIARLASRGAKKKEDGSFVPGPLPPRTERVSALNVANGDHPPLSHLASDGGEALKEDGGLVWGPTPPVAPVPRRPWTLPPMPLLEYGPRMDITKAETTETAEHIEETLKSHGIEVEVNQIKPGPTVTLYGLTPGWVRTVKESRERDEEGNIIRDAHGKPIIKRTKEQTRVRVDAIVAREKDMALALAAPSLRIQAPVPGESVVGIEVPNHKPVVVSLRTVLESPQVKEINKKGGLALPLGQGSGGEAIVTNLRKLPHLLIAGATGSGKSVCLNTIIISLVTQVPPEKLRLLLVDPKRVELTSFNGLPHLIKPVVVDAEDAVASLKGMLKEMFRRYRLMEAMGVRNIDAYQAHPQPPEPLPYLVIAVDELADLMASDRYNVERTLTRLAQLGRATGIHLVVATQRPSVDVVTGLIKANFPSRISFAVVSQVD
ncbi:MAG: hypothetical protein HY533_06385, partial [Chloroflexi bacterium]|nr:hypothetical protein [Chloroflexota bacterium]